MRSREHHLVTRPVGEPTLSDLELVTVDVPEPGPGQIVVRNTWMSVDPYMRGRMDDVPSYIPPFAIGAPLEGSALGEVIASNAATIPVGATVAHFLGWREIAVLDATAAVVVDPELASAQDWLGPLGTTGLTAYVAVTEIAPVHPGDVVFVSAAAGAVGSVAGQLARKAGAAVVIGSAGGPEKAKKLVADLGFDHGDRLHRGADRRAAGRGGARGHRRLRRQRRRGPPLRRAGHPAQRRAHRARRWDQRLQRRRSGRREHLRGGDQAGPRCAACS